MDRLVTAGLVSADPYQAGRWIAHDPRAAAERLMGDAQADLARIVDRMAQIPSLAGLHAHFDPHRWYGGPSSEFLGTPAEMNARIGEIVGGATSEICTAQPGAPADRDPEILRIGIERTLAALGRGAGVKTIYASMARDHEQTCQFVADITEGGGQVRIERQSFPRMVIVDQTHLFLDNFVVDGAEANSGWHVFDRAAVKWARNVFGLLWDRSTRWQDIRRTDGVLTERQYAILRELEAGDSQPQISVRLSLSERTIAKDLAEIKATLGARSVAQVMAWWGRSQVMRAK
ncbi:LuxR C-terminal-related transcriptional regulator [Streptomyces sp. NPDC087851]|uniref:LuxR C-terminal-related transcriptional regulator n=1 Tax=Streptomyces sp. NPDC087851 TaxID=3365810 RepID=UPI00382F80B9